MKIGLQVSVSIRDENTPARKRSRFKQLAALSIGLHSSSASLDGLAGTGKNDEKAISEKLVCTMEESPFYIQKASAQGRTEEVEKLILKDPSLISNRDNKGMTCLHHAAARGRIQVIDLLLQHGVELNSLDARGNTALHLAVNGGKAEAVKHLLVKGIDASILNDEKLAALHVATIQNRPAIIEEMLQFPKLVDVNLGGKHGGTALHGAAFFNFPECAKKLMEHGARICLPCDNGFYPIHAAAKSGSIECLEAILSTGEALGFSRACMLSYSDKERNSPLHAAVNSGDLEVYVIVMHNLSVVVKVCLEFGAAVDVRQEDQATAFHVACSQGILEIVQLMLTHYQKRNPDTPCDILEARDVTQMTPLHKAAMYNYSAVVKYLIEMGSEVDAFDSNHMSPLLLAASSGSCTALRVLIDSGASVTVKDSKQRNVLHFLVSLGKPLAEDLRLILQKDEARKLLNQKDAFGCTPLHLTSKHGNLVLLELLINLGAAINLRNNEDQSPLHFAARLVQFRYGRVNTVRKLLESPNGSNIINESDGQGMTALHIASCNGHIKVVREFLRKGALFHKDFAGCTPLHYAAENGYTQTMKLLLSFHSNLLNQKNQHGNTPLHFAAKANQSSAMEVLLTLGCVYDYNKAQKTPLDICIENHHVEGALELIKHRRWDEFLNRGSSGTRYKCPLVGLITYLPQVYVAVLDKSHTKSNEDPSSKCYWEKYDFKYMQANVQALKELKEQGNLTETVKPLFSLNTMVQHGRVELLSHPVCLNYLRMKWKAYGFCFYFLNLLVYLCFLGCLTGVIASLGNETFVPGHLLSANNNISIAKSPTDVEKFEVSTECRLALTFLFVFLTLSFIKEFVQIYQQRLLYFWDPANYVEWTLYTTGMIFVAPALFCNVTSPAQWQCATVAAFMGWFNLLLYLQRLDSVGIYVVMFLQILDTVVRVMLVFSVLFVAFGMAFYILLVRDVKGGFQSPMISILHGLMMMMGDWNFIDIFVEPLRMLSYPTLSFIFLVVFVVLMPLLFINLLIGLAVGDIEVVQKNAQLKRLAMQVEYHTSLEERLPLWLILKVDKPELILRPNGSCHKGLFLKIFSAMRTMGTVLGAGGASGQTAASHADLANEAMLSEMQRMKTRVKDMQSQMQKQHDLLRLIVQKMEIVSEADNFDEGIPAEENVSTVCGEQQEEQKKTTTKINTDRMKAKMSLLKLRKR